MFCYHVLQVQLITTRVEQSLDLDYEMWGGGGGGGAPSNCDRTISFLGI